MNWDHITGCYNVVAIMMSTIYTIAPYLVFTDFSLSMQLQSAMITQ